MNIVLFGVRSPLVVDYEESCKRLGIHISAGVSVSDTPRMIDRSRIVKIDEIADDLIKVPYITCAFSPDRRRALSTMANRLEFSVSDALVDPTAVLPDSIRTGKGTYINTGVVVGGASIIGEHVLVNRAVSLGHHSLIGDFSSIGPGATLASNIEIGDEAIIGAGAVILPNVRIGRGAVVSAGSIVRKNVKDGICVGGNPAKPIPLNRATSSLNTSGEE